MPNAKCIQFHEFGDPQDVLKVEERSIQPPRGNDVLVRMLARPINPSDLIPIQGSYSHRISLPNIPGYEGVGIVEEVGPLAPKALIGRRVLPLRGEGTWQEYVKTSADFAVPIPSLINDLIASQLYINPITAWVICTEVLSLRANHTLIVNACSSSIGHLFAQLSKILGFRLIAVTRKDTYTSELLRLGASNVINASKTSLVEEVMEITNGLGADAAIDLVGGLSGTNLAFCVQPGGPFLSIGLLSGEQVNYIEITNKAKVKAKLFHLRHWNRNVSTRAWQQTFKQIIELINEKKLTLKEANSCYDLLEVKEGIQAVQTKTGTGKVFLTSKMN